jgi:hypothetical protein
MMERKHGHVVAISSVEDLHALSDKVPYSSVTGTANVQNCWP